jgi:hypothetical protein
MPRLNTQTERYKNITEIALFEAPSSSVVSTTSAGALAYGDQVIDLTAVTSMADGDHLFIDGDGGLELNQISGTPATTDCPLKYKAELAQASGATVTVVSKKVLGYPTRDGLALGGSLSNTAIESAIAALPIGYVAGVADLTLNFAMYGWNVQNLQLMFGAPEKEQGTGTSSDPYQGGVFGSTVATAGTRVLRITGTRADLKTWTIDFLDFVHEISGNTQMGKDPASYPVAGKCTGIIKRIWA